jgi:hypothetical protein
MRLLILAMVMWGATTAQANDFLRVTYSTGYPAPGVSSESSQIFISRESDVVLLSNSTVEIDRFFRVIRDTLNSTNAPDVWEPVTAIHADTVKIEISLEAKNYRFQVGYGAHGPQISLDPSESDRLHLDMVRQILRLTTERMRSRLLGDAPEK